jgi:dodecin
MTQIANIVELVGSSDKSWEDATQVALTEATKTIRGITGIELTDMTARVDPNTGKITEYHSTVKIAFGWNEPKYLQIRNFQFPFYFRIKK